MKTMTKNRYNTIGERLLLATQLSTFVCLFVNSYLPLIITGTVFVGFIVFARIKYGYRAIEYRELSEEEKNESFIKDDELIFDKKDELIYDPAYSHLDCNIYH